MKSRGLTTVDDFKGEWTRKFEDRQVYRRGEKKDPELKATLERELLRRV
jgi:hypothetical protein